ncbi:hypothetical protein DN730_02555 [Marinomonas piezotolerans]|uniref:Lipoprotein n=1 Tax=Marinomonas piezotolerans TaxID=2213058 RepID=A0A370UDX2_9GAMM|nr:YajG family lipoprotein [Marinomonas piezotolerans]RDL45951.1 hypothetical protein DN730_02555 [Marinomonas piezotolerans]
MIRKPILIGATILAAVLLQGCANTTHIINLEPVANEESRELSNKHAIKVSVAGFNQTNIGSIDTGIGEHADIKIANNVSVALFNHIQNRLSSLGFDASTGALPATDLSYVIEELSYTTRTLSLKTEATLVSDIKVTVKKGATTYTANFKSSKVDQYGSLPDRDVVESDMNELVGQTVARSFQDPKIIDMLSN